MADHPRVAVTGAAGYLGARLLRELQDDHPDWEVTAIDDFSRGDVRRVGDVPVESVDIRDRHGLEPILVDADVVLHLAAVSGVDGCRDDPDRCYETNVLGTHHVGWACRKAEVPLAFPLSMAVVGDPVSVPITVDHPRAPLNWYGRTKVLGERAIETYADGAFPAHLLMIANLYGSYRVDDQAVRKDNVIDIFTSQAQAGQPLTVYEPGTQARNYVHVGDVAAAFVRSAERLLEHRHAGITGTEAYAIAGEEDPSVMDVAELVQAVAAEHGLAVDITVTENPRADETLVEEFSVDTSAARSHLDWAPTGSVEDAIRNVLP